MFTIKVATYCFYRFKNGIILMNFVLSFIDFERRRTNTAKSDLSNCPAPSTVSSFAPATATFIFSSPSYAASINSTFLSISVHCTHCYVLLCIMPKSSLLIPGSSPFFNFNPTNQEGQFHIVMNGLIGEWIDWWV